MGGQCVTAIKTTFHVVGGAMSHVLGKMMHYCPSSSVFGYNFCYNYFNKACFIAFCMKLHIYDIYTIQIYQDFKIFGYYWCHSLVHIPWCDSHPCTPRSNAICCDISHIYRDSYCGLAEWNYSVTQPVPDLRIS